MTFSLQEVGLIITGALGLLLLILRMTSRSHADWQKEKDDEMRQQTTNVAFRQQELEKVFERFMTRVDHLEKTINDLSQTFKEWTRYMRDSNNGRY